MASVSGVPEPVISDLVSAGVLRAAINLGNLAALQQGNADICFLALEAAQAAEVAFTAPYPVIEGVFAVAAGSRLVSRPRSMPRGAGRRERGFGLRPVLVRSSPGPCSGPPWSAGRTGWPRCAGRTWRRVPGSRVVAAVA